MKLGKKPKTYLLRVEYRSFWPSFETIVYHYSNLEIASAHVYWLIGQIAGQNGENAIRENVVNSFALDEYIRSKKRIKEFPLLDRFFPPPGRMKPVGGVTDLSF